MNRRLVNRLALAAIASIAGIWLSFWLYAGLTTIPRGVRYGEWMIGGMKQQAFRQQLETKLALLYNEPVQLRLDGGNAAEATLTLGQLGLTLDVSQLEQLTELWFEGSRLSRAKSRWRLNDIALPLDFRLTEQQLTQALTAIWPDRLQPPVKNAERVVTADDMIRYVPEQRAQAIDISRLKEVLVAVGHERFRHIAASGAAPPPAPVAVPMRERLPVVTLDTLKAQGINRKIAEYSTTFPGSVAGRVHNIQATAAAIHDKLLAPGEKFDYSTVVHATEKQIGYREAPVIFNGKLVPGVGGGICQVSSTLYNAVLLAGLKVNERRNHSLPVSYVPLGQDATYADGYINFTFTNSSGSYLLIRTVVDASKITVKLFGSLPDTITYAVESQVLQTIEPPVKYVRNPLLPEGKQVVLQQGKPGYVVDTYRSRMDNGAVVSKERLSHDTYEPQPTLIAIRGSEASADNKVAPQSGALASELIPNTLRGPQNGSRSGVRSIVEDGISGPVFRTGR